MLILGDARRLPLADGCVQCVVTSPPHYGLRDYGIPGQIGLEPTPAEYVAQLVAVFREVWRVLKDDGTLWLVLGDTYNNRAKVRTSSHQPALNNFVDDKWADRAARGGCRMTNDDAKEKDLLGIPWRVAFALQADGWYLRSDIIWHKPNPMPESVTDRPTKAHEYLFLLAKQERYYYDAAAIAEPAIYAGERVLLGEKSLSKGQATGANVLRSGNATVDFVTVTETRNKRSVWTINPEPYPDAHFATFPEALVKPCILAGSGLGDLVLDPFIGSGTVGAVAERLGRRWVGTDLSQAYHALATRRTAQRGLRWA